MSGELSKIYDFRLRGSFLSLRAAIRRPTSLIRGRLRHSPVNYNFLFLVYTPLDNGVIIKISEIWKNLRGSYLWQKIRR